MKKIRVFLIDDERLALQRLSRLLVETGRVEIAGQTTEPLKALETIPQIETDAIFLDIQMPELTGFELLQNLKSYPPVIFTTAYDEFALKAFEAFSVDYLLKPIEADRLKKALDKLEELTSEKQLDKAGLQDLFASLAQDRSPAASPTFDKIAARIGRRISILTVSEIVRFYSEDKLTFAQTADGKSLPVEQTLSDLEIKLDPKIFMRVHRSTIVNTNYIDEVHGWFSGKVMLRLKDERKTEIVVARNRVKMIKDFFGM